MERAEPLSAPSTRISEGFGSGRRRQAAWGDRTDKTALVSLDIERGTELLSTLDAAKLDVAVALWVVLSEYEDWRLVLSARQLDTPDVRKAYRLLNNLLSPAGFDSFNTPTILILPTSDPFVKELGRIFGKAKSVEGMRLGGQTIGNRFVEDAFVYRIAR